MKKLGILLMVFIFAAGFVFAQEQTQAENTEQPAPEPPKMEFVNLEVTIGFPVHWTTGCHDGVTTLQEDRFATANTAIGVALNLNFSRVIGLSLDFDFFYAARMQVISSETSDYISLSGFNLFIGPTFYLFNNNILRIPLSVGAHMYYYNDDVWVPQEYSVPGTPGSWMNRSEMQFGLGINLGVQFHFNTSIYIFSRTNVSLDLVRIHTLKGSNGTDDYDESHTDILDIHWGVKPTIGIGVKF